MEVRFAEILLLLGTSVAAVIGFQRWRIPSSLGYLFVGLLLGPYTAGPIIEMQSIRGLADFGIVFLLFTIGLNFSLPQIHALRKQVLGLGTAQVVLTTFVIGLLAWLLGAAPVAAFVIGAVFAQSSTTVISKQLAEQAEENSTHGRLGVALSVFQDVTAVPFVVIIPALGAAAGAAALGIDLSWAIVKGALAFALVFGLGRWLLGPLFHFVAARRSAESFTLAVLFVSLLAAWITNQLGLSMAFGAFLAGMVLGETEFRHQVESTIRPFRDVLLGLFFVGIGMLFDPRSIPEIWHWALAGAVALMASKILIVAWIVRISGADSFVAWRTGLLLAVGGEFGFALLALAIPAGAIDSDLGQIALTAVLFSIVVAPFLIRYNYELARLLAKSPGPKDSSELRATPESVGERRGHVVICGYGRIGQSVGHVLEEENIAYVAVDLDPGTVREARLAGEAVYFGDSAEMDILEALSVGTARLVVIAHDDLAAAHKTLRHIQELAPKVLAMVRTRDATHVEELRTAGATEVVPETLEAALMIASQALLLLNVPQSRVLHRMQEERERRYRMLRELVQSDALVETDAELDTERTHPLVLSEISAAVGRALGELALDGVSVSALVRDGVRHLSPPADMLLQAGDSVVLFGRPDDLARAERELLG